MTDLPDLLERRARQGSAVQPSMEGVEAAVDRRATRRRRRRVVGSGVAAVAVLAGVGLAVGSSGDDTRSGPVTDPGTVEDLPLIGIDLVAYVREPRLDPQPTPTDEDLTYAVFTGDGVDVLGPMMTVTVQPGERPGGEPIDLDDDSVFDPEEDGWLGTFPGGSTVSWERDGEIVGVTGLSGVSTDAVVEYAQQLQGRAIDLEEIPAPDGLERRQVVTFDPLPDFPSRTSSYQGPTSVVHVLTTREPGYFDLTRIVSTEGQPYEEIGFRSSFLGPGRAILSPDDDGAASALVRTDAGLTIHVFGTNVDPDTLRAAIEQDHLVDLTDGDVELDTYAREVSRSGDERLDFGFTGPAVPVTQGEVVADPPDGCGSWVGSFEQLWVEDGSDPYWDGWAILDFEQPLGPLLPGPVFDGLGHGFIQCDGSDGRRIAYPVASPPGTTVRPEVDGEVTRIELVPPD